MRIYRRWYVGIMSDRYEEFQCATDLTPEATPQYLAVIGPFRTHRAARIMALYGRGNPHLRDVEDSERMAKWSLGNIGPARYGEIPAILPEREV